MRNVRDPNTINLFMEYDRRDAPRCNVDWWSKGQGDDPKICRDWFADMRTFLSEPLIHTLKSPGSPQYSMVHLVLLKDLYRAMFNAEPTKGFTHKLIGSHKPIEYWQWDIFEQVQWRVANGVHPNEVISEMKRFHWRCIDREDVVHPNWNNNLEIRREWQTLRMQVLEAYKATCAACGRSYKEHGVSVHVDHIVPKSHEPKLALSFGNLQVLCEECNMGKSNKFRTDWRPTVFNEREIHDYLKY